MGYRMKTAEALNWLATRPWWCASGILGVLLMLSAGHSLFLVPFNRQMLQRVRTGQPCQYRARLFDQVDSFYRTNCPAGNLFIHFQGFDPAAPGADGTFVFEQFVRANYVLHPRRALVAPPGTRLRGAADILASNTVPDDAWLRARGVEWVLTFHRDLDKPAYDIRRVTAPAASRQ